PVVLEQVVVDDLEQLVCCVDSELQRALGSTLFPYTTLFRSPTAPASACPSCCAGFPIRTCRRGSSMSSASPAPGSSSSPRPRSRSEEHTSELQSRSDLVCRLLLDKKRRNGR